MTAPQTFTITRTFDAPRSLVWKAWTAPSMLTKWFGPKGSKCEILKQDLRVGGVVHSRLAMGEAIMWGKFTYQEITPETRLSWLHSFSDEGGVNLTRHPLNPNWPLELLTTVVFAEEAGKTKLTLTWTPRNAGDIECKAFEEAMPGMNQGWGGSFENLDEYLRVAKAA